MAETDGPLLPERADSSGRELVSLMSARVGDAFLRKPLFVDGGTDLVSLCRELARRGVGDALIEDGGRLGVFTTTNLRDALLRPEPPGEIAVREVTSFDAISVGVDDELFEALLLMLRHRVHRLVVRDGEAVVGVISQLDLMAMVASHSHLIAMQAAQAEDVAALKAAAGQIDGLIRVLFEDGVRVQIIARLVGELNRQVFRRLWELLAPEDLRANSCLIVMGSEGRSEQIVKTDQDNALLIRDGFVSPDLEAVTEAFTAALLDFGYPPCPGGIMLSRPLWRQPVAEFRETLREWTHGSDPEGPMNLAIFLDAAAVAGDPSLLTAARDHVDRLLSGSDAFYARFALAAQQFAGSEGGWWSRLPGLRGRATAEIDLKKLGIFPVVHGVRALALQYHGRELGTAQRLEALVADGRLDAPLARDLTDALHFLMNLKLATNLQQIAAGRTPDNLVQLSERGTLERQSLAEALAIVRRFRDWLVRHFRLDAL